MVTDRSCSAGLLCVLSHKFPQDSLLFVLLIGLDMCSHYTSMQVPFHPFNFFLAWTYRSLTYAFHVRCWVGWFVFPQERVQ